MPTLPSTGEQESGQRCYESLMALGSEGHEPASTCLSCGDQCANTRVWGGAAQRHALLQRGKVGGHGVNRQVPFKNVHSDSSVETTWVDGTDHSCCCNTDSYHLPQRLINNTQSTLLAEVLVTTSPRDNAPKENTIL